MSSTGIGATLVFSNGISFSGVRLQNIGELRRYVEVLDDTALDSAGFYENCPDDLEKIDPFTVTIYFDGKKVPPVGDVGDVILTFPKLASESVAAKVSGTCFLNESSTPELVAGTRMMANFSVQFDGKTGPTFSPAT